MKGLILISAYNSAATISAVLQELRVLREIEIVVVNDGSQDKTADIVRSFGVHVINHEKNLGKGAALQTGFAYACTRNIDYLITLDADKQHPIDRIPKFIEQHKIYPNAVVLGTRERDENMPWNRKFSNSVSASLISWRIKHHIYDAQCGFRLIPKRYLSWKFSSIKGFIFESEVLIALAVNGINFRFVPIPTLYPDTNHSKMTYFDSTFGFIFMYISSFFKSYKQERYDV